MDAIKIEVTAREMLVKMLATTWSGAAKLCALTATTSADKSLESLNSVVTKRVASLDLAQVQLLS